eukprot:CAMPEP_0184683148 /NCGR_PEP_ID=MMETSP0312-20130426/10038_1 /TAXON_ID=31354 /ORGANISM="Compsopogon coeruleus, Strain SAG 36.94" /LENGTH=51 /DNA_ID=CAMNT_0027135253 /DNA_START=194 /DNA_END=349 /DNA_ORIENTATION=+
MIVSKHPSKYLATLGYDSLRSLRAELSRAAKERSDILCAIAKSQRLTKDSY